MLLIYSIFLSLVTPFAVSAQSVQGKTVTDNPSKLNRVLPNGLQFRLSNGEEAAENREVKPQVKADPLSETDTSNLLKRIPSVKEEPGDKTDFARRAGSLPAPKNGKLVPVKFPAADQQNSPDIDQNKTVLEVVRFSPEGVIDLAPDLSVTFSQPMVAVTSQEGASETVPVQLTPQAEGKWRWLGTKTLMFDTTKRFPMATKFTARVPAGTKSVTGQALQKEVVWTFTTPPPKVESMIPANQITRRDALMFISFDQEINAEAVLRTLTVTGGGKPLSVRLATSEEIEKDASISYYAKQAQPKRWLAFRAVNPDGSTENALPAASPVSVVVRKGTPSAEGPIPTSADQSYSFQTYGAMKFASSWCDGYNSKNCSPTDSWYMLFTNPIDGAGFVKDKVKVEPPIEGLNIYPSGQYIILTGIKKGRTSYKVTVDNSVKDVFGQTLEGPANTIFKVGTAEKELYNQGGNFVVLDPTAKPAYSIYSINHLSVKVRIYKVEPKDWEAFRKYMQYEYYDEQKRPKTPGRLVVDRIQPINNKPDELTETRIDLGAALNDGFGNAIIEIEPVVRRDKYDREKITAWCQSTQIGLDAFVDNEELVGFATEMKTGKPLSGVELSIYPNGKAVTVKQLSQTVRQRTWWEWLWSWGASDDSISDSQTVSSDGTGSVPTEVIGEAASNVTTENGILRLPLPDEVAKIQNILIAKKGKDTAFMPEQSDYYYQDYGTWYKKSYSDSSRWFVFDDRKMYRPQEEVSVKGYIRKIEGGKLGDVGGIDDTNSKLTYRLMDARGNEILKGETGINAFGAFDFKVKLTDTMNLGAATLQMGRNGSYSEFYHNFQVQEFRRPEFEVAARVNSQGPYFVGGQADLAVEAKYYAGGGLANAAANWTVTANPTNYTPPNRGDFTFGKWFPWWRGGNENYGAATTQTFKGVTNASGLHLLKMDFESANPPRPYTVTASVNVQDVNRQTWSSTTSLLVHAADLYAGIRTNRTFVQKNENIELESIVSDIDGQLISNRDVEIKAVLKDWAFDKGAWKEETVDEQTCRVKSTGKPEKCKFLAKAGGVYTITARVMDDRERFNESEITVWVAGGKTPPKRTVEQEEVNLIPDKKDYKPGDVAEILVQSPFVPAEGVLTLRRGGIVKTERFTMKESTTTLKIPIDAKYLPNIYAQVDLVGTSERMDDKGEADAKLAKRPAFAGGTLNLPVSTQSRELNVAAEPNTKSIEPGGTTEIKVEVKDNSGEPVAGSEVAVVVVDESVLALTGYRVGNPLYTFYAQRGGGVMDYHLRKDILLGNPLDIKQASVNRTQNNISLSDGPGVNQSRASGKGERLKRPAAEPATVAEEKDMDDAKTGNKQDAGGNEAAINLRTNFNALALFSPSVKTDSSGRATVPVKLPDNLTRYRIMAVSVDAGKRFGSGESNLTAKQPLMARPSAPRFMNFGDKMELPVVVQNQTDNPMTVNVAVRATNATLTNGSGRKVVVPANDRVEVRFPVAADKAGTARFQIAVTGGKWSDAAEISLPVWTPATTEAFATYGTTDENGALVQPIEAPKDVYAEFGGLEVTTSSTQLQELTDAFIYLHAYQFECSEQVSSRMISVAALQDVLKAFKAKDMPTDAAMKDRFAQDIAILQSRQNPNGYFGLWRRDNERYKYPFVTAHVAHALVLAKAKGYKVPEEMLTKVKPYLKDIEKYYDEWHKYPTVRWTISAYALYVRDLMGDKDVAKAKALLKEATIEKMPFEALGWVLSVLADDKTSTAEVDAIKRFLMNRTTETAATANFVTDYGDGAWLIMYSNRRADGVLLEALLKAEPNNDLIPKLVRGLLDHRTKGAWANTQENVFILLALDKYFNTYEKVTPDFVTKIWLGNTYAGEELFKGRSVDSNQLNIPMSFLLEQSGKSNLIFDKQGAGRLYYRIGMKYAPKNLKLAPADYGFTVLRKYEAVDNAGDVKQLADGSWTIKAGARVRVKLTMVAQARRYHVALVDPIPAGLEILNPDLAVTEPVPADPGGGNTPVIETASRSYGYDYWYWRSRWFEHQNFRDERAEAFSSLLWEGVYNYTYVTRATTPGQFVVPPAKAEEMYHPETFGRSGTDFVRVE